VKEPSQEIRTFLAIALSMVVILVWGYFFRPKTPPQVPTPASSGAATSGAPSAAAGNAPGTTSPETAATGQPSGAGGAGEAGQASHAAPAARAAAGEQKLVVQSGVYRVEFSNLGASVRSWQLSKEKDDVGKTLDLVHAGASEQSGRWPLMLAVDDLNQEKTINGALYEMTPASGTVEAPADVEFAWSDGHLAVTKRLKFDTNFVVSLETSVTLDGKPVTHFVSWRGGFGDVTAFAAADQVKVVYSRGGSLSDIVAKKAGDEKNPDHPVGVAGTWDFAGIVDHYYGAVFLPDGESGVSLEHWKYDRQVQVEGKTDTEPVAEVAAGAPETFPLKMRLFVGPKDLNVLGRVKPPLTDLVTFGYLGVIARPLFDFLKWIYRYVPNFGWAIVLMTIAINMVLFPLKYRSFQQMLKMQSVMPEVKQIQDRYKKYGMRDPRKQEMNKEVMAVYQREGVNPVGSCLPMVVQMPIWFSLYRMLDVAFELRHAPWIFWVHDLSSKDPYYIIPILMCVTTYLQQKLTPNTTVDPAQQRMMNFMPLFMGFLFMKLASGLNLYILTSNVVGTVQQWFLYQVMPEAKAMNAKKKGALEKKNR
jgi:YidC/Oxa1 family membrane protein insertase